MWTYTYVHTPTSFSVSEIREPFFFFFPLQLIFSLEELNSEEVTAIPMKRSDVSVLALDGCIQAASLKIVPPHPTGN